MVRLGRYLEEFQAIKDYSDKHSGASLASYANDLECLDQVITSGLITKRLHLRRQIEHY